MAINSYYNGVFREFYVSTNKLCIMSVDEAIEAYEGKLLKYEVIRTQAIDKCNWSTAHNFTLIIRVIDQFIETLKEIK